MLETRTDFRATRQRHGFSKRHALRVGEQGRLGGARCGVWGRWGEVRGGDTRAGGRARDLGSSGVRTDVGGAGGGRAGVGECLIWGPGGERAVRSSGGRGPDSHACGDSALPRLSPRRYKVPPRPPLSPLSPSLFLSLLWHRLSLSVAVSPASRPHTLSSSAAQASSCSTSSREYLFPLLIPDSCSPTCPCTVQYVVQLPS